MTTLLDILNARGGKKPTIYTLSLSFYVTNYFEHG